MRYGESIHRAYAKYGIVGYIGKISEGDVRMRTQNDVKIFLKDIYENKKVMWGLAKNDLRARFASSFLGTIWAFIQPLITLLVMWFVFEVGFKNPPVSDVPFIMWLTPAYLVWSFFSEALVLETNCLTEYSYLVKKVDFQVGIVPVVKMISSAFVHAGFIVFIFVMMLCCRIRISIYSLQVVYYFLCTCLLLAGMGWILAAVAPFVKDVVNVVNVVIQIGFWATPIFWTSDGMSPIVQTILKINPMFYICRGYRDCFIDHYWFWQYGGTTVYFWVVTLLLFCLGAKLFNKLRPQFADVL